MRQPVQHRHLASVPRHESPTRVAHYRRKIPSPRKAAIRLMQRPRYTSEVERDARSCGAAGVPRASASPGRARVIHTYLTWPATRGVRVGTAAWVASRGEALCAVRPLGCLDNGVGASCAIGGRHAGRVTDEDTGPEHRGGGRARSGVRVWRMRAVCVCV